MCDPGSGLRLRREREKGRQTGGGWGRCKKGRKGAEQGLEVDYVDGNSEAVDRWLQKTDEKQRHGTNNGLRHRHHHHRQGQGRGFGFYTQQNMNKNNANETAFGTDTIDVVGAP